MPPSEKVWIFIPGSVVSAIGPTPSKRPMASLAASRSPTMAVTWSTFTASPCQRDCAERVAGRRPEEQRTTLASEASLAQGVVDRRGDAAGVDARVLLERVER